MHYSQVSQRLVDTLIRLEDGEQHLLQFKRERRQFNELRREAARKRRSVTFVAPTSVLRIKKLVQAQPFQLELKKVHQVAKDLRERYSAAAIIERYDEVLALTGDLQILRSEVLRLQQSIAWNFLRFVKLVKKFGQYQKVTLAFPLKMRTFKFLVAVKSSMSDIRKFENKWDLEAARSYMTREQKFTRKCLDPQCHKLFFQCLEKALKLKEKKLRKGRTNPTSDQVAMNIVRNHETHKGGGTGGDDEGGGFGDDEGDGGDSGGGTADGDATDWDDDVDEDDGGNGDDGDDDDNNNGSGNGEDEDDGNGEDLDGLESQLSHMSSADLRKTWNVLSTRYTEEFEQCIKSIASSDTGLKNYALPLLLLCLFETKELLKLASMN